MALILVVEECRSCETVRVGETDGCECPNRRRYQVELPFSIGLVGGCPTVLDFDKVPEEG